MLSALLYYWSARAKTRSYYAMKREIARVFEVTSVEYVRYRLLPVRNRAAETSPIHAYIARAEDETGLISRFVFRTRSDTHGCVYDICEGFIRTHKDGANALTKNVRKGEHHPWLQQRT